MSRLILIKQNRLENIIHIGVGKRYARELKAEDKIYKYHLINNLKKEIEILRLQTLDDEFRTKRKKQNELYDKFIQRLKDKRK